MNEAQLNYVTIEEVLLAIVFAFDKFRSYLIGAKVIVYMDHVALSSCWTRRMPSLGSSDGFYCFKTLIWRSEIKREERI